MGGTLRGSLNTGMQRRKSPKGAKVCGGFAREVMN